MHEASLMTGLIKKIESVALQQKARKVVGVTIKLGALSNISAAHFREHFIEAAKSSIAEGALLAIEESHDIYDQNAQEILVEEVEVV
jgi:hydrogenase nickel incorporation protein HypA/HybF